MDLTVLEALIETTLPQDLLSLSSQPHPEEDVEVMRLMDPCEAADETQALCKSCLHLNGDILVLWTDDNGNYAGVFARGDLAPRVTIIDEEPDDTPRYFSVTSFEAARRDGARRDCAWYEFTPDYPVKEIQEYETRTADRELALKYLETYKREATESRRYLFYALALFPPSDTHLAMQFLWDDDMWVQEKVCNLLGYRNYHEATAELTQVAMRGSHNGRLAAILALKAFDTEDARKALKQLKQELGESFAIYFR